MRGYCAAVRAALTDDGLPPLAGAGLKLHDRLSAHRRQPGPSGGSGGGSARRSEASPAVAAAWPGGDGRFVPAGARGLQVGQARGAGAEERGGVAGQGGAASSGAVVESDASGGGDGRLAVGRGGPETLPEGEQELLAGLVPVLRVRGSAADEQRPGARLRQPSLSRASCQRSASGLARIGGDGLGAADLESGDAAAAGGRLGIAAGLCAAMARAASGIGSAARVATKAAPLPP